LLGANFEDSGPVSQKFLEKRFQGVVLLP
jgi:hypothetical protein